MGQNNARVYLVDVHLGRAPRSVTINGGKVRRIPNKEQFEQAGEGCFYAGGNGVVQIKTPYLSTAGDQVIRLR